MTDVNFSLMPVSMAGSLACSALCKTSRALSSSSVHDVRRVDRDIEGAESSNEMVSRSRELELEMIAVASVANDVFRDSRAERESWAARKTSRPKTTMTARTSSAVRT